MQEVPYEKWLLRIDGWIKTFGLSHPGATGTRQHEDEKNLVVDLGCGTGTLTEKLAGLGYDMIGIDRSQDMLNAAIEKKDISGSEILYLCQEMQEMDLYSTVGTFVCVCDSLNYLLAEEDVLKTFKLVKNYLYPGGIFIFDFNTGHKYEKLLGYSTIAENYDDCAFIWENYYDADECLNESELFLFIQGPDGLFARHQETHYQKGYELGQIRRLLAEAGLAFVAAIDDESENAPDGTSERIFVVARNEA
jgi:SAM-dependent methyltransferase